MNPTGLSGHRSAQATRRYDAIVVGARCAGAATAMLLARKGHDVLLVDRASFPSDTVSTHVIHPPGLAALRRWGLLDDLVATGCPWLPAYTFDLGPLLITGTPTATDGTAGGYAPRRIVLDELLVRAAEKASDELREGFSVTELITDGDQVVGVRGHARGGMQVSEYARVVIGADGVHSRVAEQVNAPRYRQGPVLASAYYAYWSGVPATGGRWMLRPGRGFFMMPTNDDLTLILAAWPQAERVRPGEREPTGGHVRVRGEHDGRGGGERVRGVGVRAVVEGAAAAVGVRRDAYVVDVVRQRAGVRDADLFGVGYRGESGDDRDGRGAARLDAPDVCWLRGRCDGRVAGFGHRERDGPVRPVVDRQGAQVAGAVPVDAGVGEQQVPTAAGREWSRDVPLNRAR